MIICAECKFYTGTYSGFELSKKCKAFLDPITGETTSCRWHNSKGKCKKFDAKNKEKPGE